MVKHRASDEILLSAAGITKTFPGTMALDHVDLQVRSGEIHALLGANGAGKTTLMMILSGVYRPDEGRILIGGHEVRLQDPHHAQQLGIGTVFQELSLVPGLSIAENLLLGHLPVSALRFVDWTAARRQAATLLSRVGLDTDPATPVRVLPPAIRQLVEIAKALAQQPRILLFDEPTAALTGPEVERLFAIMRELKASGLGIVFITHRMWEVFRISDRITILRDGRRIGTFPTASVTPDSVVSLMVGHELPPQFRSQRRKPGEVLLEVTDLFASGLAGITFQVRRGEILGIVGMPGSGREALGGALFGLLRRERGQVALDGRYLEPLSPVEAIRNGIGYIPSDRKNAGLFLRMSVRDNIVVTRLGDASRFGIMRWFVATTMARGFVDALQIRATSLSQLVGDLSGGTQQKVLVARWLAVRPNLLIAEDPTVGIDIATRVEIHGLLRQLADQGSGVLLITSDLPEALAVADRILVVAEGRIVAERAAAETSEEELLALAAAPSERVS